MKTYKINGMVFIDGGAKEIKATYKSILRSHNNGITQLYEGANPSFDIDDRYAIAITEEKYIVSLTGREMQIILDYEDKMRK